MSERTAAVFQRANEAGYFAFDARLLTDNRSPRALSLFESMMLDRRVSAESRVQCLHVSIVPGRMDSAILRTAEQILSRNPERDIANGVVESVFDFDQDWFGIESGISRPADWETASEESLRAALAIADRALASRDIESALHQTVGRARERISKALITRGK